VTSTVLDPYNLQPLVESGELQQMRQSTMEQFDICPARMGYSQAGIRREGEARLMGTAYHAGLAEWYGGNRNLNGILVAAHTALDEPEDVDWETDPATAFSTVEEMLGAYIFGNHEWDQSHWEIVGVEQAFYMPLTDGWAAHGTIDLVLRSKRDGQIIIVDHKTSKKKWARGKEAARAKAQGPWYSYWARELYNLDYLPPFVYDVMTRAGDFDRRWVSIRDSEALAVVNKARTLCQLIATGAPLPTNTSSNLCSGVWCDSWNICPSGAQMDGVAVQIAI
jgi:hypothetical protein